MRFSTLSIAVASLVASFASASALPQPQFRAGILECEGGQNVGFVVGSTANLECVFQSQGRRPNLTLQPCAGSGWISASPTRPG
jgi:hypothetical protein